MQESISVPVHYFLDITYSGASAPERSGPFQSRAIAEIGAANVLQRDGVLRAVIVTRQQEISE